MSNNFPIRHPSGEAMNHLCTALSDWADRWNGVEDWPGDALRLCGEAGVYRWFLPVSSGGHAWNDVDQTRGYLRLAATDLTTTFVITQYMGAMRRIAGGQNQDITQRWLEPLATGQAFGTVGISHLTTSGRHHARPLLMATETNEGFRLSGFAPWVTGAAHADVYVVGASLDDGREILAAIPSTLPGVKAGPGTELVALSASCTDRLDFDDVMIDSSMLLAGPVENVMQSGSGANTGGLQTSTLAVGLARAAVGYLATEASRREDLAEATGELIEDVEALEETLLRAADGDSSCNASDIRGQANRLVLRTTQAAMTAAKGAGFVEGHPVGRWCRQALFFLVWSCPQPVAQAHLCELAGIES